MHMASLIIWEVEFKGRYMRFAHAQNPHLKYNAKVYRDARGLHVRAWYVCVGNLRPS